MNTKFNKLITLWAVVLVVGLFGCSNSNEPDEIKSCDAPFTFLKVGNKWDYQIIGTATAYKNDSLTSNDTINGVETLEIVSEKDGAFRVNSNIPISIYFYWKLIDNDLYMMPVIPDAETFYQLVLPKNCCNVGYKWGDTVEYSDEITEGTCEILSVSEKVTVPAGTFTDCIKIKSISRTWDNITQSITYSAAAIGYYHKDFGFIKRLTNTVHYYLDSELIDRIEIEDCVELINKNF